jgi:hypothetical protein
MSKKEGNGCSTSMGYLLQVDISYARYLYNDILFITPLLAHCTVHGPEKWVKKFGYLI